MFRSHRGLLAAGLAVAFTLSATAVFAQGQGNQGQGNQGGRRGGGGPGGGGPGGGGPGGPGGGFFGGGGPGGRGGNPMSAIPMLLGAEVVQTELKLTDDQKQKIQAINEKANTQRTALFEKMRANRGNRGNRGNNNAGNNTGNNAGNNNNGGGTGNTDNRAIFDEMNALQKDTESALAKVLDKNQTVRVSQIAWQAAGPEAFRSDILTQKLNIDEGQATQINEVLDGLRNARRDSMRSVFASLNGGNNGATNGNAAANGGRANGGNNNGGNNNGGNNNNGGRGNRPDFNDPAVQAKLAEARTQGTALSDKAMAAIGKVLKTNQKKVYQNLVGAKFANLDKINPGRRGGPGGPGGTNNTPATTPAATAPAATTPAASAAAKPAARVPLSQRRGAAVPK